MFVRQSTHNDLKRDAAKILAQNTRLAEENKLFKQLIYSLLDSYGIEPSYPRRNDFLVLTSNLKHRLPEAIQKEIDDGIEFYREVAVSTEEENRMIKSCTINGQLMLERDALRDDVAALQGQVNTLVKNCQKMQKGYIEQIKEMRADGG